MKKIKYLSFLLICFFVLTMNVEASSFSISASTRTVMVGSTVRITTNCRGLAGRFDSSTSNSTVLSGGGRTWCDNGNASQTFTARSVGSATVTVRAYSVANNTNGNRVTGSRTVTIRVVERSTATTPRQTTQTNANQSSNSFLASLGVEGYRLSPAFDRNTNRYTVNLPSNTTSIHINARAADSNARVTGTGRRSVTEGSNTFRVVVTAENGTTRTYTINAIVEEKEPIIVTINDTEFTVVRRAALLSAPNGFEATEVTINEETVPALYNETTGLTLVGLTNEENEVNLYIFDEETESFIPYIELRTTFRLLLIAFPEDLIPEGYKPFTIEVNDVEKTVYKLNEGDDFALVYGINAATGESGIYIFDIEDETLQRFIPEKEDEGFVIKDNIPLLALAGVSVLLFITNFVTIIASRRKLKKILKTKKEDIKKGKK